MQTNEAIEQWTEIRLSPSDSSSSGYSNASLNAAAGQNVDDATEQGDTSSSSSNSECNQKVTCTTVFQTDNQNSGGGGAVDKKEKLASWLSKSGNLKSSSRRQSLDLLIDASDRVKDVFTNISFTKVGKTLERRSSESEIPHTEQTSSSSSSDFFSFRWVVEERLLRRTPVLNQCPYHFRSDAKEGLSDEQVLNLELEKDISSHHVVTGLRWPHTNTYGN